MIAWQLRPERRAERAILCISKTSRKVSSAAGCESASQTTTTTNWIPFILVSLVWRQKCQERITEDLDREARSKNLLFCSLDDPIPLNPWICFKVKHVSSAWSLIIKQTHSRTSKQTHRTANTTSLAKINIDSMLDRRHRWVHVDGRVRAERSRRAESASLPCGSTKRPQENTFTSKKWLWSSMFPDNYTHTHTHTESEATHTCRNVGSFSERSLMFCSTLRDFSERNLVFFLVCLTAGIMSHFADSDFIFTPIKLPLVS